MFTGIIEEIGKVKQVYNKTDALVLEINANKVLENTKTGDSICTNGVCLTVTSLKNDLFTADVMQATLASTNLNELKPGNLVNLERAAQLNSRLGGHLVSGHIDGTGKIIHMKHEGISKIIDINVSEELLRYMIKKGSVCIDGISLTIQDVKSQSFQVSLIPETINNTNFKIKKQGDILNIEVDMLIKFTERLLTFPDKKNSKIDMDFLTKQGF